MRNSQSVPSAAAASAQVPAEADRDSLVIIVEQDPARAAWLSEALRPVFGSVALQPDRQAALNHARQNAVDLCVLGLDLTGGVAAPLVLALRDLPRPPEVLVVAKQASALQARDALVAGAHDVLFPPLSVDKVAAAAARALSHRRLVQENLRLRELAALYEVSARLDAGLDLERTLRVTAEGALALTNGRGAQVRVRVDQGGEGWDSVVVGEFPSDGDVGSRGGLSVPMTLGERRVGSLSAVPGPYASALDEGHRKALTLLAGRAASAVENARLYRQLGLFFRETVKGFVAALEAKDRYTKGHSDRVRVYAQLLAEALALPPAEVLRIGHAAQLHDIGKLGMHSHALLKDAPLEEHELVAMQAHPLRGEAILARVSLLRELVADVRHHHERWDGGGYPDGLGGAEIPLGARIIAVADAYDAMTTHRPYRRALLHDDAVRRLQQGAASQFDPDLVVLFLRSLKSFRAACSKAGQWVPR